MLVTCTFTLQTQIYIQVRFTMRGSGCIHTESHAPVASSLDRPADSHGSRLLCAGQPHQDADPQAHTGSNHCCRTALCNTYINKYATLNATEHNFDAHQHNTLIDLGMINHNAGLHVYIYPSTTINVLYCSLARKSIPNL